MRYIHQVPFSPEEIEYYRRLIFQNLTEGMRSLLEVMEELDVKVQSENAEHTSLIKKAPDLLDLRERQPFPRDYLEPLRSLWNDANVSNVWLRANEYALPEKSGCSFSQRLRS